MKFSDPLLLTDGTLRCGMYPPSVTILLASSRFLPDSVVIIVVVGVVVVVVEVL
jgi:hypothetical protein